MPRSILVTGASGFVGRALLAHIARNRLAGRARVVALSSAPVEGVTTLVVPRSAEGLYQFGGAEFADAGLARVEEVIHLGAFTPKSGNEANDAARCTANIVNTKAVLDALPGGLERLVFASTLDVYAAGTGPIAEESEVYPSTLYGMSKLYCEKMLTAMAAEGTLGTATLQILRLGHIYGPGEDAYRKFIPATIRRMLDGGSPRVTTDGSERRSFLHIDDCCRMILAALRLPAGVGPVNVASGTPRSVADIARVLAEIGSDVIGRHIEVEFAGNGCAGVDLVFDVAKMERHLGTEAVRLETGLREEFEWFAGGVA